MNSSFHIIVIVNPEKNRSPSLRIIVRGRHQRRDYNHGSLSNHIRGSSHQSHSHLLRDRSNESREERLKTSRRKRHRRLNVAINAMSRALQRVARLPFSEEIERTKMPRHFTCPSFTFYNGKTEPVEHVSPYS